jgi:uncharacterized protein (DUF58 family)
VWAALNLHGLKGQVIKDKTLICGALSQVAFTLQGDGTRFDLRLKSPHEPRKMRAQRVSPYQRHHLTFTPQQRGVHYAPPFLLETHFPFGLVRVWQWLYLPACHIAPKPDFQRAHLLMTGSAMVADQESDERGEFNADSLENWQEGIPLSRISWKHYAAKDRLLYKTGAASGHDVVRLHFHDVALDDYEAVLSVLCGGILLASEAGNGFELALEDRVVRRFAHDETDEALRLLALCQRGA